MRAAASQTQTHWRTRARAHALCCRAQQLITGLGSERARWSAAADTLSEAYKNLPGDVLLAAAHIAYLGAFPAALRCEHSDTCTTQLSERYLPATGSCYGIDALARWERDMARGHSLNMSSHTPKTLSTTCTKHTRSVCAIPGQIAWSAGRRPVAWRGLAANQTNSACHLCLVILSRCAGDDSHTSPVG